MGVDLYLLPLEIGIQGSEEGLALTHCALPLERRRNLWDKIRTLPLQPAPSILETLLPENTRVVLYWF